jgi:dTDP-4-dehydrorhamnose 3,5-epimerase
MDKIKQNINGIKIIPLRQINDERGAVYHVLNSTDSHFTKFGEAYFSKINSGVVKAWKYHKEMTQNFSVPYGKLKLVCFDSREDSSTYGIITVLFLDPDENYNLIQVPPKIWYGFQCISKQDCLLLNIADISHDPYESMSEGINSSSIKYKWR